MKTITHKLAALFAVALLAVFSGAIAANAATSSPDDLVNTEGFFTIGPGITSGEIELQFGSDTATQVMKYDFTDGRFEYGDDVYVTGTVETTDDIIVGGDTITLDSDNAGAGADIFLIANQGSDSDGILKYNATTDEWEISTDGGSTYETIETDEIDGTDSNTFTMDQDDTGGDVVLQFGTTLAESLTWDSTNNRFNLSDDLYLDGGLEVNAAIDFNQNQAVELVLHQGASFPGSPVTGQTFYNTSDNKFYVYNGSSWVASTPGGLDTIFLAPLYPHATYYADGSNNRGRLTYQYDNTNNENGYRWETTRPTSQDYDIVIRVQLPENWSSWDTTPIEFKYRTDTANTADNQLDLSVLDTAGASVTVNNAASLANTSWTTANITYSGTPTWTAGDWFTIQIKNTATNAGGAEAGTLVLNYNASS